MSRTRVEWMREEKGEHRDHLTMIEFARTLGVGESTFKRWARTGKIPAPDAVTPSGWRLWSPDQVSEAIRRRAGR